MNRIIHFEIQSADPERAAAFYRNVFGWDIKELVVPGVKIPDENRYWHVTTGPESEPGVNGGILFRRGPTPTEEQTANAFVCTIGVSSVDASLERALKNGARLVMPKMPVTGVGWLVYCRDTEGNTFGMMQEDKNAR